MMMMTMMTLTKPEYQVFGVSHQCLNSKMHFCWPCCLVTGRSEHELIEWLVKIVPC